MGKFLKTMCVGNSSHAYQDHNHIREPRTPDVRPGNSHRVHVEVMDGRARLRALPQGSYNIFEQIERRATALRGSGRRKV
jgi:hypothetical protein